MHQWFMYLFEQRMDATGYCYCFECGRPMHESQYKDNSCIYSHLIEKSKYPAYAGDASNLKICCPDCHTLFSMKPKEAVNQYKAAQEFKQKHNL
jgi:5-methylcytosine-specific restriction endonuclease McrA